MSAIPPHAETAPPTDPSPTTGTPPTPAHPRWRWGRRFLLLYILLLHALCVAVLWEPFLAVRVWAFLRNTPEERPDYRGMVAAHVVITRSLPAHATVFLGDSRMRDLDAAAVCDGPVYNLSIGGDTAHGLRSRLTQYSRLDTTRMVIVGVGVNDLSHVTDDEAVEEYHRLLDDLASRHPPRIVVCGVLPVDEPHYTQANSAWLRGLRVSNARIAGFNQRLRSLCEGRSGVVFVDSAGPLLDDTGNLKSCYTADGLHLNASGSAVWAAELKKLFTAIP